MARKGRDLFEILRERSGSSRPAPARAKSSPARAPRGGPDLSKVGDVGRGVVDWVKKKVGKEPEPAPRPSLAQNGILLAAVAALALLLGFVVGRFSTGTPVQAPGEHVAGLRKDADSGPKDGRLPDWVREGDAVSGDVKLETDRLWNTGFLLVWYPALERRKAADLAVWLRRNGLPDTRIRDDLTDPNDGSRWAGVICYTKTDEQAAKDLATLRRLDLSFDPLLSKTVAALKGPQDVTFQSK